MNQYPIIKKSHYYNWKYEKLYETNDWIFQIVINLSENKEIVTINKIKSL